MNPQPTVSAIVATRNRPELLRRALRSMVEQGTEALLEVIVVFDQAEPDYGLIDEFPQVPIRVVANDRTPGLPGARNTGILLANGEWIAFCDDDDQWEPTKLTKQLRKVEPDSIFVVTGIVVDNQRRRIRRVPGPDPIPHSRLVRSRVMEAHPSTYLISKTSLIGDLGLFDEDIPGGYYEDYDILLRAVRMRPVDVVNEPLTTVHWHPTSFFANRWKMIADAADYLLKKFPELQDSRTGSARIGGQKALALAALGERQAALDAARAAFKRDPRQLRVYLSVLVAVTPVKAEMLIRMVNAVGRGL